MTLSQLRAVLTSYYRRPIVWVGLAAYWVMWVCFGMQTVDIRSTRSSYFNSSIVNPLTGLYHCKPSPYAFNSYHSRNSWDRLRLTSSSDGAWSLEDLKQNRIPTSITQLDASSLLAGPEEREIICGQAEWPAEESPAGRKLLAFYDDLFERLARFPRLTHLALPPLQVTGSFAALLDRLPPVDHLVFTGSTVFSDGWLVLARLRGIETIELHQSILYPGISRLAVMKDLQILTVRYCSERETPFLAEFDSLRQVKEFRVGTIQVDQPQWATGRCDACFQSPRDADLLLRLIKLKTTANIRLLWDGHEDMPIREFDEFRSIAMMDPRFRSGLVSPYAAAGLGHTFIPAGILIFLLAAHLFGQLATPQAWLSTGMARSQVIVAAGLWGIHTLATLVYGSFWGTSPLVMLAAQLVLPGAWGLLNLLSYRTELIGNRAAAILCWLMYGLSGSFIQLPFFLGMIPGAMELAAGEMPIVASLAAIVGAILCGFVAWQLPGLPRAIEMAGIGNFPLRLSLSEIQSFQQQRVAYMKQNKLLAQFSRIKLAFLPSGAFWNSSLARIRYWSAPIPLLWPQCLLGCIAAPIVGCLAVMAIQFLFKSTVDLSSEFIFPTFSVILLQSPPWMLFVIFSLWLERSQMTGWELLRPVNRQDLGTTYAGALAIEIVPLAGWSLLTTLLVLLLGREPNSLAAHWPMATIPAILVTVGFGWLIVWACLLAMLATGGWWQRAMLMAVLVVAAVLGIPLVLYLSLPIREAELSGSTLSLGTIAGYGGAWLLAGVLVVFLRQYANRQWRTREFLEG